MRLSIETIFVGLTIFLLIYLSQSDNSDNINENVDERVVIMPGYINPYYRNPYYHRYPHYYTHLSPHRRGPGPRPRHHRYGPFPRHGPQKSRPHRERNNKSNIETPATETPATEISEL